MEAVMVPGVVEVSTDELATLHREIDRLKKELHKKDVILAEAVKASGDWVCVRIATWHRKRKPSNSSGISSIVTGSSARSINP